MAVAAFISFVVTVLFMFALRPVAFAVGLVDVPGGRKRHGAAVPVIGGIAMAISFTDGSRPKSLFSGTTSRSTPRLPISRHSNVKKRWSSGDRARSSSTR